MPTRFSGSTVVVWLLDVRIVDIPARVIGETRFAFSGGPTERIPFDLTFDEARVGTARLGLSAEIRTKDPARLQAGDWVTTRAVPLSPPAAIGAEAVEVGVERIPER